MKMRSTVAIALLILVGTANGQQASVPGRQSKVKSQDGRFIIRNFDDQQEPPHRLTLVDVKTGSANKIYSYGRHVDVLWSPRIDQPLDLLPLLKDFLSTRPEARSLNENHHVYFSAQRWLDRDEILCRLTGYGEADPNGFTKRYVYKIGHGFRPYR